MTRDAAIVGIGQTEFSKASGRSELQLAAECSRAALADAGLDPADVDAMITFSIDGSDEIELARCLGVRDLGISLRLPGGGMAAVSTLQQALSAIQAGSADVVLIWRAMNERSQYRFGQPTGQGLGGGMGTGSLDLCLPYGAQTPASWEALAAQRYMTTYGVSSEDLGRVSVTQRAYAARNPHAWFYQRPITLDDHQNSKWIVEPVLRLLDCCQESDGGVALVVTSLERARDLRQKPVQIVGVAESLPANGEIIANYYHDDLSRLNEAYRCADKLYRKTGLSAKDIQVAAIYDAFTTQVLRQLEAFGFCPEGEAKDFVRDGNTGPGGRLPVNTHGGLIGEAYIHGMNSILEMVRQLRGDAINQVDDAETALVTSIKGAAILGRA